MALRGLEWVKSHNASTGKHCSTMGYEYCRHPENERLLVNEESKAF